ncbi:hypothetical protein DQ04_08891000 [Trypanosoma grayi]|uniref:hypothetical protein n=1 Tax=Trypanosoma grayi TaxID=71804 RepID=UPI0004F3FC30|nr:hypothetical protein DQ04_08891000 [Trypanosoma grayi]KEG07757.1 hypothetical protein DQ04_08891000 [Trypanosoma grayi]
MVKAMCDAMELILQEEEQAFIRAQAKGKRRKKAGKAPALLPHQKSAIPLHMMRRSHLTSKEFYRFFDELPLFAAAFTHVWLPAFFAMAWPPVKTGSNDAADNTITARDTPPPLLPDEDNSMNRDSTAFENTRSQQDVIDWENIAAAPLASLLADTTKRRSLARRIVEERLEHMKQAAAVEKDGLPPQG